MFENIIGQSGTVQLAADIAGGTLAPSMLFSGPPASGKGTAGLELGRILSCEDPRAPWNCPCKACAGHRLLFHPDLLVLGSRPFSAEIAAAASVFLREPEVPAARTLFIRSIRKLLIRFTPVIWENDPKIGKLSGTIEVLNEEVDRLSVPDKGGGLAGDSASREALGKRCDSILKKSFELAAGGVGEFIPVDHIRRAAWWTHLAPVGKRKLLLIENADRLQEGGRNALLKILEEPPERVTIVLTSARGGSLLPTMLSRLRPYRFYPRDRAAEEEVIRRVFRNAGGLKGAESRAGAGGKSGGSLIDGFIDSFLPVSGETLYALAAFFAASLAWQGAVALRKSGVAALPPALVALGKYAAPIAEAAGYGRPTGDTGSCVTLILKTADNFAAPGGFHQFLEFFLTLVSKSLRDGVPLPGRIGFAETLLRLTGETETAVGIYNQNPALALDRYCTEFRRMAAEL
ncbi:MAG: DNA polymerase III [Spirochaetaceae bacterium]|nr:DNA polymerase III [Spirochaetaceae bacterium]